jgi:LPXTG-motif cell wall-anchored protein
MLLVVSSSLTNALLALTFVPALSESLILAVFGASLILGGIFLNWRRKRNRTDSFRSSNSREITNIAAALASGVETNSSLIPPGWDGPFGVLATESTSTAESGPPPKRVDDSNLILK